MTKPSPTSRYWPQNAGDSPRAALTDDSKLLVASTSSSKKCGKRGMQKRVVSIPIKDIEGMKLKGDQMISSPPSDSWTWRKYGQKPIKGSPYPRGYYRCSSSKGCPAKKQVERSKTDPKLLLITYSHEHNHPFPIPSSRNHRTTATTTTTTSISEEDEEEEEEIEQQVEEEADEEKKPLEVVPEYKFPNINDEFGWISEFESTSCMMLESPILADDQIANDEMAMIFTMREEDEPLFADLGELPECSTVFRRATAARSGNHQLINQITM